MNFTNIMLIVLAIAAFFGAMKGRSRGIGRQAVRTITVAASVIIALVATESLTSRIFDEICSKPVEELVSGVRLDAEYVSLLSSLDPETLAYIAAIFVALLIAPIFFVIIFELTKLLMLVVHAIVSGICGFSKKRNNATTRLLGALLGAVQGVACAVIISVPAVGLLTAADTLVARIEEDGTDSESVAEICAFYHEHVEQYSDDPVVNLIGAVGADALYDTFSEVTIQGTSYDIDDEVAEPVAAFFSVADHFNHYDWSAPSAKNKRGLTVILDAVDDSPYMKKIAVELCEAADTAYDNGLIAVEGDELLVELVTESFNVIGSVDEESFGEDFTAILDAYYIFGRENIIASINTGDIAAVRDALTRTYTPHELDPETPCDLSGEPVTVLRKVVEILSSDDTTKPLITTLSKISVAALAKNLGSELSADEIYDTVKVGLTETLAISKEGKTEEEYTAEVRASLEAALAESDIEFREDEQYILDNMATYVSDNYETLVKVDEDGNQVVTEDEINEVVLSYYEAYLSTGALPDGSVPEESVPEESVPEEAVPEEADE